MGATIPALTWDRWHFPKNNISSLAERCGNQVSGISLIGIPPKPENKNTEPTMKYLEEVTATCRQLADSVQEGFAKGSFPFVVGGDHSLGIGSIAGLSRCIPADQLSVVWIDAHTDINTNLTSESHNIHGMPLAACLGLGDNRLYETMGSVSPFLLAQNLFYIGSRSVDEGEEVILAENNIRTIVCRRLSRMASSMLPRNFTADQHPLHPPEL
mgnify:CR=1 FL=1